MPVALFLSFRDAQMLYSGVYPLIGQRICLVSSDTAKNVQSLSCLAEKLIPVGVIHIPVATLSLQVVFEIVTTARRALSALQYSARLFFTSGA